MTIIQLNPHNWPSIDSRLLAPDNPKDTPSGQSMAAPSASIPNVRHLPGVHLYITFVPTKEDKATAEKSGLAIDGSGAAADAGFRVYGTAYYPETGNKTPYPIFIASNVAADGFYPGAKDGAYQINGNRIPHLSTADNDVGKNDGGNKKIYSFSLRQARDKDPATSAGAAAFLNAFDESAYSPEDAAKTLEATARSSWPKYFQPRQN